MGDARRLNYSSYDFLSTFGLPVYQGTIDSTRHDRKSNGKENGALHEN